jgi:hypothetical protein
MKSNIPAEWKSLRTFCIAWLPFSIFNIFIFAGNAISLYVKKAELGKICVPIIFLLINIFNIIVLTGYIKAIHDLSKGGKK